VIATTLSWCFAALATYLVHGRSGVGARAPAAARAQARAELGPAGAQHRAGRGPLTAPRDRAASASAERPAGTIAFQAREAIKDIVLGPEEREA